MSLERELYRGLRDAAEQNPMADMEVTLQRWTLTAMAALKWEIQRDPDLITEFGFAPANLFDVDGNPVDGFVFVL